MGIPRSQATLCRETKKQPHLEASLTGVSGKLLDSKRQALLATYRRPVAWVSVPMAICPIPNVATAFPNFGDAELVPRGCSRTPGDGGDDGGRADRTCSGNTYDNVYIGGCDYNSNSWSKDTRGHMVTMGNTTQETEITNCSPPIFPLTSQPRSIHNPDGRRGHNIRHWVTVTTDTTARGDKSKVVRATGYRWACHVNTTGCGAAGLSSAAGSHSANTP